MNVRTLQAPTRERLSPILTSTKKIVTVERTETCRGERDFRIQGLPHSAVQEHDHIRKKAVQKLIHQFEESSEQRTTTSQPNTKSRVQSVQRAVEGNDLQQGKHGVLRDLRDHTQHTMHQLYDRLSERYCILHMRNMLTTFRQSSQTQQ